MKRTAFKVIVCSILCCHFLGNAPALVAQSSPSSPVTKAALQGNVALSLKRAIEVALEYNPELAVERIKTEQARAAIEEQQGAFDPVINVSALLRRNQNVVASRFYPTGTYLEKDQVFDARYTGRLQTGARYGVVAGFHKQISTSNTQTLSPQYSSSLAFSLSQPLLRDFGFNTNRTKLRVAEKAREISSEDLTFGVSRLVFQVVQAYWNFVFLREQLDVRKKSLDASHALLANNENLFSAGRIAFTSVHEARTEVAEREEEMNVLENEVGKAEDILKILMHADAQTVTLIPQDRLQDVALTLDTQRSYSLALDTRPEIARLQKEVEMREKEVAYAGNQTKPRLDLNLQYAMNGLSGKPNPTPVNPLYPEYGTAGDSIVGSVFQGLTSPFDSLNRFFRPHGFDNYQAELSFELPLHNKTAESRLSDAQLQKRAAEANLASAQDRVMLEIRDAMREIAMAKKSLDSARVAITTGQEQVSSIQVRFDAGFTTSYEVLKVLDDVSKSRTRELKALMDQSIAYAGLLLAEGSILDQFSVEINAPRVADKQPGSSPLESLPKSLVKKP